MSIPLILTGGGTGGHTFTAVSIAEILIQEANTRGETLEIRYMGSKNGLEFQVAQDKGWKFIPIASGKLRRYLSWQNFTDLFRLAFGFWKAFFILLFNRPRLVIGTGGYVAVPVVVAAGLLRIPIRIHEQTAVVGLANKICLKMAGHLYTGFEKVQGAASSKTTWVGTPVRKELFQNAKRDRKTVLKSLGFNHPDLPLIYITGGAQGSHRINELIYNHLESLLPRYNLLHQCGGETQTYNIKQLAEKKSKLPEAIIANYQIRDFVRAELPSILVHAKMIIGRSGAGSVNEWDFFQKHCILVPLPGSAGGEQVQNAHYLAQKGLAEVIEEKDLNIQSLLQALEKLGNEQTFNQIDYEIKYQETQQNIIEAFGTPLWRSTGTN